MKRVLLILFFLEGIICQLFAQQDSTTSIDSSFVVDSIIYTPNNNLTHKDTIINDSSINSSSLNTNLKIRSLNNEMQMSTLSSIKSAGKTLSQIDVSATGAALYTVPIYLPPGIKGVIPQVGLSYNSQTISGLAGLGWNISGLSSITRVGTTKFHDDVNGVVNFTAQDRFALDGQRLILKSGVYGGNGAEYQTENYSNIKVISRGVSPFGVAYGPAYFEVYYPDGSVAYYGNSTDSRSRTDYALTYIENPQQVRISYQYIVDNNLLLISQIKYGSKGTGAAINVVNFNYKDRIHKEQMFIGGISFYRTKILNDIYVTANNSQLRRYELTYNTVGTLNYERLISLQEFSSSYSLDPIYFNYDNTDATSPINHQVYQNLPFTGASNDNSSYITGDFTGDGSIDFVVYPNTKSAFYSFFDPIDPNRYPGYQMGSYSTTTYFKSMFSATILNDQNKLMNEQAMVMVKPFSNQTTKFEVYRYRKDFNSFYLDYTREWLYPPTTTYYSECNDDYVISDPIPLEYFSGDFNGDGLTDVLAFNRPYSYIYYDYEDAYGNCNYITLTTNTAQAYFYNLDRRSTLDYAVPASSLRKSYNVSDRIITGDFNGNGKTDLVHITNGLMEVYEFNEYNSLRLIWETADSRITTNPVLQILPGDYNGDGKTDIMFATADNIPGNDFFATFFSNGNGFNKVEQTFPFRNLKVLFSGTASNPYHSRTTLIPNDINGDGKTDIISLQTKTLAGSDIGDLRFNVFHNTGAISSNGAYSYILAGNYFLSGINLKHSPIPIFLNKENPNYELQFGVLSDKTLNLFGLRKDLKKESLIRFVQQNGITYNFNYKKLMPDYNSSDDIPIYYGGNSQQYPNVDLTIAPGLNVVSKLSRTFDNKTIQQLFGYREAVSNIEGLGFLGFKETIRTNWIENEGDDHKLYTINITSPTLRGALVKSFVSKYNGIVNNEVKNLDAPQPHLILSNSQNSAKTDIASQSIIMKPGFIAQGINGVYKAQIQDLVTGIDDGANSLDYYISRTDYTYKTELLSNKVFLNISNSVSNKDLLNGTHSLKAFEHDNFYNVIKETSNLSGIGTTVKEIEYENSISGEYYIGRPLVITTLNSTGNDTFKTEEHFTYTTSNLPSQIKKKGNNTPFITENLTYDTYGNITSKTLVTASGQRTTQMQYDPSGRFVSKIINPDGLETDYEYYPNTGNLMSETDSYNLSTYFIYDTWGRKMDIMYPSGLVTSYDYNVNGDGMIIHKWDDQGVEEYTTVNALGKIIEVRAKDIVGQFVKKTYEYDAYDRQLKESEPYINSNPSQWTVTEYDKYGRLKSSTLPTGKVTNISYNGLSTTINDGTKSVVTNKNALGRTISVQDPGGTIYYDYNALGNLKTANYDGSIQQINYDGWGRKIQLTDPSAGNYNYVYDDFGQLTNETTPKGSTSYTYDVTGKLLTKRILGDGTDMNYQYSYDNTFKQLTSLQLTNSDGNNATYTYAYNPQRLISSITEDNSSAVFIKNYIYDDFYRVFREQFQATNKSNNKTAIKTLEYHYSKHEIYKITDFTTGLTINEIQGLNARGQVTNALMNNSIRQNNYYDDFGFPQNLITNNLGGTSPSELINLSYSFNTSRGLLTNRSNSAFSWNENFAYDSQDRLTNFNDNNGNNSHIYDNKGRITNNSQLGDYTYNNYQQIQLNNLVSTAHSWYQDRALQQINYNAFKSPVEINEEGKERISFQYNAGLQRAHMYYGSTATEKMDRPYRRHYSEDGTMEITEDIQNGTTNFVFYLGGDAYSAPAIWKEIHHSNAQPLDAQLYFLHRDHLGSIVMITDAAGNIAEKRQFDAWGNIVKLENGNGVPLTAFVILDRGYTGHEHLLGVGLIHMNGRLYDPKLHRFLQPDNYVQDPYNSQNFNRYGYVYNNPLSHVDPSGEVAWFVPILVGAFISTATNGINNLVNDMPFFNGAGKAALFGGIGGAFSMGIGNAVSGMSGFGKIAIQTLAHGHLGGTMSAMNGGSYGSGFLSGAFGSLAASGTGALLQNSSKVWEAVGTISLGALSGGIASEISGGNFWDGIRNGAISSGLNHAAHAIETGIQQHKEYKFFNRLRDHYESKTGDDFTLTKKEVNFLTSKGKIDHQNLRFKGDNTWEYSIDFYDAGFDLKYSFGRATGSFRMEGGKFTTTSFFDRYDFDPKAWGTRTFINELITRGYNIYSSGKAFNIIYNGR